MSDTTQQKQSISLAEHVCQEVRSRIDSGIYPANTRLPGELELAAAFNVSRPVVRQALAQLRAEGMIVSRQGAGTFVTDVTAAVGLRFGPLSSVPDVQRCLEFRLMIESEAAAVAALARSDADLQEIARRKRLHEKACQTAGSATEEDFDFHLEIAKATRNRFLIVTLQALRQQIMFGINLISSLSAAEPAERLLRVKSEHDAILDALAKQDADAARHAMRVHLDAGLARLFDNGVR